MDGPHGVFTVDRYPRAPAFLFVAGGVGIAPIASMLRTLADRGDRRPLSLVYGTRSWEETILRDDLARLDQALDLRVIHVLEEPHAGWQGATGRPEPELVGEALAELPDGAECFLCGPTALGRMAQHALHERGVPLRRIHYELFELG